MEPKWQKSPKAASRIGNIKSDANKMKSLKSKTKKIDLK